MHLSRLLTTTLLSGALLPVVAFANPEGGLVVAGDASIASNGNKLDITQTSQKAIIDWRGFDIAPDEHTQFHQPDASSIVLNRINDTKASRIDGRLTANGNVVLVNPNGVFIGRGASIDVGSLTATTSDIDNNKFMNDTAPRFDKPGSSSGAIVNEGTITAREAGLVGFVAPRVENKGTITAKFGKVQMASGDTFTLDLAGDGITRVAVTGDIATQLVNNEGTISANGGLVELTAAAARNSVDSLITNSGYIEAKTVGTKQGRIILYAEGSNAVIDNDPTQKTIRSGRSTVINSGILNVSGINPGEIGGKVRLLADQVELRNSVTATPSLIDASGDAGGGEVLIGGDYMGQGTVPTALTTYTELNTMIKANALNSGNGGKVILWADDTTTFSSRVEVRALGETGDGGFVETSGKKHLILSGGVAVANSRRGKNGEWLLDPADVSITNTATTAGGNPNFVPTGTASVVNVVDIVTALNANTNVTITTSNDGYAGSGDITVSSAITGVTGSGSLTLSSYRNITVSAEITLNGGALTLRSDNAANSSGYVNVSGAITTNGGALTIGGGNGTISEGVGFAVGNSGSAIGVRINGVAVNASGGAVIINGRGFLGSTSNSFGVSLVSSGYVIASGNIKITGVGGGRSSGNFFNHNGVNIASGSYVRSSGSGSVTVTGTGGTSAGTNNGFQNYGVNVASMDGIAATGTGTVTVNGTGGGSTSAGTANTGIFVTSGSISANGGAIIINGMGGRAGTGVQLTGTASAISNTGSGALSVTGTGGAGSGTIKGVVINSSTSLTTVDGTLTVQGAGGQCSATNCDGVQISGVARATGNGNISVTGTGGTGGTGGSSGVFIGGSGIIVDGTGAISVTGTGGTGGNQNYGVSVFYGPIIGGGTGAVTVTGTGGNSAGSYNHGIYIVDSSGFIRNSGTGAVNLSGTGGGTSNDANNYGILLDIGGGVDTVNGDINIYAAGGSGSNTENYSLYIAGPNYSYKSYIKTTGSGNIIINAPNGGAAGGSYGINLEPTNALQTTGTGNITINVDSIYLTRASNINSVGSLTIAPLTVNSMGLAGSAGTLSLDGTSLGYFTAASYTFGSLSMTSTLTVEAYTWSKPVTLLSGSGGISFAGTTAMGSNALLARTSGNITLASGASITSTASGNAVVLAAGGNFINNSGSATPITVTGGGRWIGYSTQASSDTSGLSPSQTLYSETYNSLAPASITTPTYNATQNTWVYSSANPGGGTITITALAQTITYGNAPNFTPTLSTNYSFSCSDSCSSSVISGLSLTTNATTSGAGFYNAGSWTITASGASASNGYAINYVTGALTINTRGLTVTGVTASNKTYDGTTTASLTTGSAALSGVLSGDTVSLTTGSAAGTFNNANVGVGKTITVSGLSISGTHSGNYTLTQPTTTASITAKTLNISANALSKTYGDADPTLTYVQSGLLGGDSITGALARAGGQNVGIYAIAQGTLSAGSNYSISFTGANFTIHALLTVTASNNNAAPRAPEFTLIPQYVQRKMETPLLGMKSRVNTLYTPQANTIPLMDITPANTPITPRRNESESPYLPAMSPAAGSFNYHYDRNLITIAPEVMKQFQLTQARI